MSTGCDRRTPGRAADPGPRRLPSRVTDDPRRDRERRSRGCPRKPSRITAGTRTVSVYQHVLCAVDGSSASERAVEEAVGLAERHGAHLTVLTVRRDVDSGDLDTLGLDRAEETLEV